MKVFTVGALACGLLMTGCVGPQEASVQDRRPAAPVQRPVSDVESLLLYHQHISKLKEDQLSREYEIARAAYAREGTDFNRARLGMLLELPNTALTDSARALELLAPLAKASGGRFSALAALLVSQINERKRLDANSQDLQKKLDALKSLERSMMERKR